MIDRNAVLEQARMGTAPANWRILHASKSFFIQSAIVGVVLLLGAIAAIVYILTSHTVFGYGLNDSTSNSVLLIWLIIDLLVLLALAILGIVIAVNLLRQMGTASDQLLVLMPQGFVRRLGSAEKDTIAVAYQDVVAMRTQVSNGTYYLTLQIRGRAQPTRVRLDNRFGKANSIAQEITGTWANVAAQMRASS